jgi:hypothetical protein
MRPPLDKTGGEPYRLAQNWHAYEWQPYFLV